MPTDYKDDGIIEQYQKLYTSRRTYFINDFLYFVGNVVGKEIIDVGCGDGHLCHNFISRWAKKCIGIDSSEEWIERAKQKFDHEQIQYEVMDGTSMVRIDSNSFDVAVLYMVLVQIERDKLKKLLSEIRRVLKIHGEISLCHIHPALLRDNFEDSFRRVRLPDGFNYFESGIVYELERKIDKNEWIKFSNVHWNIERIMYELVSNGFVITDINEPAPPRKEQWLDLAIVPEYIFLKARKDR